MTSLIEKGILAQVDDPDLIGALVSSMDFTYGDHVTLPPPDVQLRWLKNALVDLAEKIAYRTTSPEVLDRLIEKDRRKGVIIALASNPALTNEQALQILQKSPDSAFLEVSSRLCQSLTPQRFQKLLLSTDFAAGFVAPSQRLALAERALSGPPSPAFFRAALKLQASSDVRSYSLRPALYSASCVRGSRISTRELIKLASSSTSTAWYSSTRWNAVDTELFRRVAKGDFNLKRELVELDNDRLTAGLILTLSNEGSADLPPLLSLLGPGKFNLISRVLDSTTHPIAVPVAEVFLSWGSVDWSHIRSRLTREAAVKVLLSGQGWSFPALVSYIDDTSILKETLEQLDLAAVRPLGRWVPMTRIQELLELGLDHERIITMVSGLLEHGTTSPVPAPILNLLAAEGTHLHANLVSRFNRGHMKILAERRLVDGDLDSFHFWLEALNKGKVPAFYYKQVFLTLSLDELTSLLAKGCGALKSLKRGDLLEILESFDGPRKEFLLAQIFKAPLNTSDPWVEDAVEKVPGFLARGTRASLAYAQRRLKEEFGSDIKLWHSALTLGSGWTGSLSDLIDAARALA